MLKKSRLNFRYISFSLALAAGAFFLYAPSAIAEAPHAREVVKERAVFGKSSGGLDLYAYRLYRKEHKLPMRPAIIITGGIHGNEYMGLVKGLAELIGEKDKGFADFFAAGGMVYLIPEINPDGVAGRKRYNPKGVDLNRDFKVHRAPGQTESSQLASFMDKEFNSFHSRPIVAVDYHCCAKSLIYPELESANSFYQKSFEKIVELMRSHVDSSYKGGVSRDFFGHDNHGTLKGYWFEKYGALSFTYEGAHPREEIKKLEGHHNWWREVAGVALEIYDNNLAEMIPPNSVSSKAAPEPAAYTE